MFFFFYVYRQAVLLCPSYGALRHVALQARITSEPGLLSEQILERQFKAEKCSNWRDAMERCIRQLVREQK